MDQFFIENMIKIGVAVFVGGVIGAEREYLDKAAGFRTIILITLGSALFTIFSLSMDAGFTQTRIAANIVTGIGFLGAVDRHRCSVDCVAARDRRSVPGRGCVRVGGRGSGVRGPLVPVAAGDAR